MDETEITKKTYNQIAARYAAISSNKIRGKKHIDFFLSRLKKGATILDLGCGAGLHIEYFLKKGFKCCGADISNEMLKIARRRLPMVKFSLIDIEKIKSSKKYDAITAFYSLTHIKKGKLVNVLRMIRKMLKPGGAIFIEIGRGRFDAVANNFLGTGNPVYGTAYYGYELKDKIRAAGFNISYLRIDRTKFGRYSEQTIYVLAKN